ncbi:hypothetical protein M1394_02875, partial [Candidatus Marsarchaeota archaeon]|nr:hypothetical protein [Candidatus Marsarchaeota archaeon]
AITPSNPTIDNGQSVTLTANPSGGTLYTKVPLFLIYNALAVYPNPFQQMITINALNYTNYLSYNGNTANFELEYSNGTIIPSWIESNDSNTITIWAKVSNTIFSAGSNTIYLTFVSKNTNLLSSSGTLGIGEAPQLSSSYAEYDDGANVFAVYFNADTPLSSFTKYDVATLSQTTLNGEPVISFSASSTFGWAGFSNPIPSEFIMDGWVYTTQTASIVGFAGQAQTSSDSGYLFGAGTGAGDTYISISKITNGGLTNLNSVGPENENSWEYAQISYNNGDMEMSGGTAPQSFIYSITATDTTYTSGYVGIAEAGDSTYTYYRYMFIRAYPPNGVMPSVSFGSPSSLYSYKWYTTSGTGGVSCTSANVISGSTLSTYLASPTTTNSYAYQVTDSASTPESVCSASDTVTVNSELGIPTIIPSNTAIDNGQSIVLSSSWSGGTADYTAKLYSSATSTCNTGSTLVQTLSSLTSGSATFSSVSPTSITYYCIFVTDSAPTPETSNSISRPVIVYPAPTISELTPSNTILDYGQRVIYNAIITGGSYPANVAYFNGISSNVITSLSNEYGNTQGETFLAWVNPNSIESASYGAIIFGYQGWVSDYSGRLAFFTNELGPMGTGTPTNLPEHQWSMITATVSSNVNPTITLYVNGKQVASSNFVGTMGSTDCQYAVNVVIGDISNPNCGASSGTIPFNGYISDAQIYNYTLSPTSINTIYEGGIEGSPLSENLIGWWKLNNTINGNVIDYSGNNNQGHPNNIIYAYPTNSPYGSYTANLINTNSGLANSIVGGDNSIIFGANIPATGIQTFYVAANDLGVTTAYPFSSTSNSIVVNPTLGTPTLTSTPTLPSTITAGNTITFTSSWSGGTSTYTANYLIVNTITGNLVANALYTGITGTSNTFAWTISSADEGNTVQANVIITDSATTPETTNSVNSAVLTLNVALGTPSITPSNPIMDGGQSITFSSSWSGGTPDYTAKLYSSTTSTCNTGSTLVQTLSSLSSGSASFSSISPTSTTYYCIFVTDSATSPETTNSVNSEVVVNPTLVANSITPSSPKIDSGQSITLTANPSGGTTTYSYKWYTISGSGGVTCTSANIISGATSSTYSASPTSTNSYAYQVIDAATTPESVCSAGDTVNVNPTFQTPTISPSNPTIDSGQSVTFTSTWSGGTADYTAKLYSSTTSTCNTGSTLVQTLSSLTSGSATFSSVSPTSITYYCIFVTDSASSPETTNSITSKVVVNPALVANSINSSTSTIENGQSLNISLSWSGGTPDYTIKYYSGSSQSCASDTILVATHSGISSTNDILTTAPSSSGYYCASIADSATSPNIATSNTIFISVQSQSQNSGGSGPSQSHTAILNDNINATVPSLNPVFNALVTNAAGTTVLHSYTYYQNQLPATITTQGSDELNLSFACSLRVGKDNYTYSGVAYGLGFEPCGVHYIVYGGTIEPIYSIQIPHTNANNTTSSTSTVTSTTTTSISTSSTSSENTTIPTTVPTTIPNSNSTLLNITLNLSRSTPQISFSLHNEVFTVLATSNVPIEANLIVVNNTVLSPTLSGLTKLLSFTISLSTDEAVVNSTVDYPCSIPPNDIAPYIFLNNTWTKETSFIINPSGCTISFAVPRNLTVGIFTSYTGQINSTKQESSTTSGSQSTVTQPEFWVIAFITLSILAILLSKFLFRKTHYPIKKK